MSKDSDSEIKILTSTAQSRVSIFNEEILLVIVSILLITQVIFFISQMTFFDSVNPVPTLALQGGYLLVFFGLTVTYFPKRIKKSHVIIIGLTALILRLLVLNIVPVISTDLHRNLIFGSLLSQGWNPYLWTLETIPSLLDQGTFISKVSYISEYATHSYDYPSLAIMFFAIIVFFVPADNFSAFILAKIFLMLFDVANAYLIYRILRYKLSQNPENSKKVALVYLLNPFAIFWIGLEGQFESVPLFFILLAVYFVLSIKRLENKSSLLSSASPYLAGVAIAVAFLFKYFSIIFIPAIIYYYGKNIKASLRLLISVIVTIFFLSLPFIISSYYITNFLTFQISRAHNFLNTTIFPILGVLEITLFPTLVLLFLIGLLIAHKNEDRETKMFLFGALSMIVFIFINPSIFSWYILWLFPFLAFISFDGDEFFRSIYFWGTSLAIFIVMWNPSILSQLPYIGILGFILTNKKILNIFRSMFGLTDKNLATQNQNTNTSV